MIDGVVIEPLRQIPDERGMVMHMLRADSPIFERFGEIYFSTVNPGAVKAWKLHKEMTLNYAVPVGTIRLVLFDARDGSPTKGEVEEIIIGRDEYNLVRIPPGLWAGFQGLGPGEALIANCATLAHDPEEVLRLEVDTADIPYTWNSTNG